MGSDNRTATYVSAGDNSTEQVFRYTILAGDNDSNGISIGADALDNNGGTIRAPAHNNAILTHDVVDNNSSYKVDTTPPSVDNFTISDTLLTIGETMAVELFFSEQVIGFVSDDDITFPNLVDNGTTSGTLTTMISTDNKTWEGTFTPTDNAEDDNNTLSLATTYTLSLIHI